MEILGFVVVAIGLLYVLYENGYLYVNNKRALVYVGSLVGKNQWKVKFNSCTGNVRRILRLEKNKEYHFVFQCELEKGDVKAKLLDRHKKVIFVLEGKKQEDILITEDNKYYLCVYYKNASGNHRICWN